MSAPVLVGVGSENHSRMMEALGLFLGLAAVECVDKGQGEKYILTRADGKTITLHARAQDRRGFMTVDYGQGVRRSADDISPRYAEIHPGG